jgi:hypothetical protein
MWRVNVFQCYHLSTRKLIPKTKLAHHWVYLYGTMQLAGISLCIKQQYLFLRKAIFRENFVNPPWSTKLHKKTYRSIYKLVFRIQIGSRFQSTNGSRFSQARKPRKNAENSYITDPDIGGHLITDPDPNWPICGH